MRYLEQALGLWALRFLIATLTVTPLRQLFNINLLRYRRALGLLAFYYAALHLTTYLVLDQGLDFAAIWADIVKRPYITIGMATFVILVPLAADLQQRRDPAHGRAGLGAAASLVYRGGHRRGAAFHPRGEVLAAGAPRLRGHRGGAARLQAGPLARRRRASPRQRPA